jgi:hypothetical protein
VPAVAFNFYWFYLKYKINYQIKYCFAFPIISQLKKSSSMFQKDRLDQISQCKFGENAESNQLLGRFRELFQMSLDEHSVHQGSQCQKRLPKKVKWIKIKNFDVLTCKHWHRNGWHCPCIFADIVSVMWPKLMALPEDLNLFVQQIVANWRKRQKCWPFPGSLHDIT